MQHLAGARIAKIAQPEADELLLTLKSPNSGQVRLLLSASASLPLIYFTSVNKPSPVTAPAFLHAAAQAHRRRKNHAGLSARLGAHHPL